MSTSNIFSSMIKKAFILAAGLGTRLGIITEQKPKALVEINGKPMLQFVIEQLMKEGIEEFIINIHHHGQQVLEFLKSQNNFGAIIHISDESDLLLGTGGAIVKTNDHFTGTNPVLIYNVDVLSNLDLKALENYHSNNKALATLCVRKRQSSRQLLFDDDMKLVGWHNIKTGEFKWVDRERTNYQSLSYSGVYLTNPDFAEKIPFTGKFSIIEAWLKMASSHPIVGYLDESPFWFDLGTEEKISAAENYLKGGRLG